MYMYTYMMADKILKRGNGGGVRCMVHSYFCSVSCYILQLEPNKILATRIFVIKAIHGLGYAFFKNFNHPQQYKTMLLPVKNGQLILTCKCT